MKKKPEQSAACGTSNVDSGDQSAASALPASAPTLEAETGVPTSELIKSLIDLYPSRKLAAGTAEISTDQIHKYMRGENEPTFTTVRRLAQGLGISLDELVAGNVPYRFRDAAGGAILGAAEPAADEFVRLPLYAARAAGGHGALNGHEGVEKMLAFRHDWLQHEVNVAAEHLKLVTVSGDSMAPRFNDGDVVMINDAASEIDVPAIYVFVQEGLMLVKRLQRLPGGRVRVSSENAAYESYELDASVLERADSFVVGRVVWAGVRV